MNRKYLCEGCGGFFESDRDDDAAEEEFKRLYPGVDRNKINIAVVCDDCHNEIQAKRFGRGTLQ